MTSGWLLFRHATALCRRSTGLILHRRAHQEGAVVGYNPKKPGRPSHVHHTYMLAGLRLVMGVETAPG
ncbi:MAG: hypothetical protein P8Y36_11175, partial [Alphaproteobacteria bacterium]